jgi:mono/diheme cytochrome c family protein
MSSVTVTALFVALISAAALFAAPQALAQQKYTRSQAPNASSHFVQEHLVGVDDMPGHQLRLYEVRNEYPDIERAPGSKSLTVEVSGEYRLEREQVAQKNAAEPEAPAPVADDQRGRLLYDTYCIACHTTQAHWRDKHIVKSWADLLYQVTRMQSNAGQEWGTKEIIDVAAYLNERFYKMPCPITGCRGSQARIDMNPTLARDR